jgi:tetratricopeptide (TPR) repeat protein
MHVAEDWRKQLQSDDPKVRAQAVKAIALSGDQANLKYLKEIVENDPNPQLREYAKKAARHLYTSGGSQEPEQSPIPQPFPPREKPKAERRQEPPEPDSSKEPPSKKVNQTERTNAEAKVQRALAYHMKGQTQKALKSYVQGLDLNPYLVEDTFSRSVAGEITGLNPDIAIQKLMDPEERKILLNPKAQTQVEDSSLTPPPGKMSKSEEIEPGGEIPLVQIWLRFFKMTEEFFRRILAQANTEDTLISVLVYVIASMLSFLISSFGQLQRLNNVLSEELGGQIPNLSPLFLGVLISMIFLTPLSFYFGVGIQYLGMRVFGGLGTFKQHAYIMGMIIVPMTVLSLGLTIPALVPVLNCIAGLAGLGLSIFSIVIMVRGMQAVHNLSTGQTIAGLIVPPLVLAIIAGCLFSLLGSALMAMLGNMLGVEGSLPQ